MIHLSKQGLISFLALASFQLAASAPTNSSGSCNSASLNTTVGSWPVTSLDTIFSIAAATERGVCDIARANRMADPTLMVAGETLLIPGQVCNSDNHTCLVPRGNYSTDCVKGGLHVYNSVFNDTYEYIAQKFQVSLETITSGVIGGAIASSDEILNSGTGIKVPQCSPSRCDVQPYRFVYGTYADLAKKFNTTVGQIIAFNPTYNYSSDTNADSGPIISLPINCANLSDNTTVIS